MADYNGEHSGVQVDTAIKSMGIAPAFVEKSAQDTPYTRNDFVTKSKKLYRLNVDSFYGPWDASKWIETTGVNEIRFLRNRYEGKEHVTVKFTVNTGIGIVSGLVITIRFMAGATQTVLTKTLDANGECDFYANYGEFYRIEPASLSGYMCLKSRYYAAITTNRTINMQYTMNETAYYIIDIDRRIIKSTDWNTSDNDKAMFILCSDSQQQIIFPKAINVTSAIFQAEYVDCPIVTNRSNATNANSDFSGKSQCNSWIQWATTPDATTGKTPIQTYNETQGKSYTIDQYLPAISGCYNKTITFDDNILHGYLPAMGQLRYICDNRTDIAAVHALIGGSNFPNFNSGYWWSCSECINYYCWYLFNGATDYTGKNDTCQLFALYDLSEINL